MSRCQRCARRGRQPQNLQRLHQVALPCLGQFHPRFEIDGWSRPARHIGGDLLVSWPIGHDGAFVLVADAMGHGASAAVVASAARALLHQLREMGHFRPAEVLTRLNRALASLFDEDFVTATACLLDGAADTVTLSQAGHPAALLHRDGTTHQLAQPAMPLGLARDEVYEEQTAAFVPGDLLVLYSDGVTDALAQTTLSGAEALAEVIAEGPCRPASVVRRARRALRAAPPAHDDCSILAVRRRQAAGRRRLTADEAVIAAVKD